MTQAAKLKLSTFIVTRIRMLIEKEQKRCHPQPGRDPAFSKAHFINVVPHHDRSTMFMILKIIKPNADNFTECLFKIIVFRAFISNPIAWLHIMSNYDTADVPFTIATFRKEENRMKLYDMLKSFSDKGSGDTSEEEEAEEKKEVKYPDGPIHRGAYNIGSYGVESKKLPNIAHPKIYGFTQYLTQLVEVIDEMSLALQSLCLNVKNGQSIDRDTGKDGDTALGVLMKYHDSFNSHKPTKFAVHLVATSLVYIDPLYSLLPSPKFVGGRDSKSGARGGIFILNGYVDIKKLDERRAFIDQATCWLNEDANARSALNQIIAVVPNNGTIYRPYDFEMVHSSFCEYRKYDNAKRGNHRRIYKPRSDAVSVFELRTSVENFLVSRGWNRLRLVT